MLELSYILRASVLTIATAIMAYSAPAASLQSPDGRIQLDVDLVEEGDTSRLVYKAKFDGRVVVADSTISFVREDGVVIGDHVSLTSIDGPDSHRETWEPVYGERSTVEDSYREINIHAHDSSADCPMTVVFRCYDAGIAFKTILGSETSKSDVVIREERSEFCFLGDHTAWCTSSAQGAYGDRPISKISGEVERPLVLHVDDNTYAAILEAKLVDYPRMRLRASNEKPNCIVSSLSGSAQSEAPLTTPWRVIMMAETPGRLLENNDIVLNLNDPCEIEDTSWIKPGKVIRDITLTNDGAKACIDFAVEHNLQFVEFDAGWYGHENDEKSDATTVTLDPERSDGPFDLGDIIDYATDRDIGVILYVNRRALETQMDEILPLYQSWGVAGVKFGFVNVGTQYWTSWLHEAIRKAADYQLMVDVHDEYRPTGYSRTYPNLMTQEGVRGDEESDTSRQAVITLFTRGLAGASDRTVCYFDSRVAKNWSRAHQLAKSVCSYSPWQFVYWYDRPPSPVNPKNHGSVIEDVPELEFFRRLPTVWDDTKVISGEVGPHALIARRSGNEWFVGAMNGGEKKELSLPLSFLPGDREYVAHIYADDLTDDTATRAKVTRVNVNSNTTLNVAMRKNGGQAIHLVPASELGASVLDADMPIAVEAQATPVKTRIQYAPDGE